MNLLDQSNSIRSNRRRPCRRSVRPVGQRRKGVAAVELAIVLPVLLVLIFGTIEICQRIFLRQSLVITAYEGVRLGARRNSTNADVISRCNSILTQRRVVGATVTVTPENILSAQTTDEIQVTVTAPWASNTPTRFVLNDQGTVQVQAVMLRE